MAKKFVCYWGQGYSELGEAVVMSVEFFDGNVGYTDEDVELLNKLEVGKVINFSCVTSEHFVMRVA
jgi:hypothetical protein